MIYFVNDYNRKIDAATARKYIDKEGLRQVNLVDMYPENLIPLEGLLDHVNGIVRRDQDREASEASGFLGNYVIVSDSQLVFEYLRFLFMLDHFSNNGISFVFSEDGNLVFETLDSKGNFRQDFYKDFSFVLNEDAQRAYLMFSSAFEDKEQEI